LLVRAGLRLFRVMTFVPLQGGGLVHLPGRRCNAGPASSVCQLGSRQASSLSDTHLITLFLIAGCSLLCGILLEYARVTDAPRVRVRIVRPPKR
jgi:hypothetical protein